MESNLKYILILSMFIVACSKKKDEGPSRDVNLKKTRTKTLPVYGASTDNIKQSSFYLNDYDREEDFPAAYMAVEKTPVEEMTTKVNPEVFFSRARTVDGTSYVHRGADVKVSKLENTFRLEFITLDMIKTYKLAIPVEKLSFDKEISQASKDISTGTSSLSYSYRKIREMKSSENAIKSLSALDADETVNGTMWLVEKKIPLKNKKSFYTHTYIIRLDKGFDSKLKSKFTKDDTVTISYKILDSGIK
ncbi:hypothetical protein N9N67_03285 [Bacteriovoracaceae bacterium]|nr:hypothetical protein [Bacteriovoracaceae bacterium]